MWQHVKLSDVSLGTLTPVERRLASGNCGRCVKADRRWVVRKLGSARAILGQALYPGLYQKCSHGWNKPN